MAIHDQNGVARSQSGLAVGNGVSLSAGPHSGARIQVNDEFSCWNDYAPKARKPYTITKQRERWTDEEHKKFLEALKLYGRAWRKIEEHVGSKTAVQIRSHAQKFFSKVLRDPNGSSTSSMESIEIPPPRPKRKPMHPYPRKLVELPVKGNSNPEHLMRSNSLKSSDSDQENQSPKSVLSAFGSDTQGSTDLETQNGSSSPISPLTGADTSGFSLPEPKNLSKEDRFPSLPGLNADTALDEQPLMKFKFSPKGNVSTKDVEESSGRTLKLFGATLMVNETCRPSTPTMATCKTGQESDRTLPWSHMRQGLQGTKYLMQHKSGKSNVAQGVGAFVPWSLSHIEFFAPSQKEEPGRENLESNLEEIENKFLEKEVYWSGSNSSTINDYENSEKSETEGFFLSKRSIAASERLALSVKGFVPYKRGIAEIENQSSTIEEREEQRIRLSL